MTNPPIKPKTVALIILMDAHCLPSLHRGW